MEHNYRYQNEPKLNMKSKIAHLDDLIDTVRKLQRLLITTKVPVPVLLNNELSDIIEQTKQMIKKQQ